MRGDHDGVPGLQGDEALEDGGGGGVGRGDDRADDADRLGDPLDAADGVLLDHAAGLGVLVGVVDVLGGVVVLDDLVLHQAHARLLDGHLGQRDAQLVGRHRRLVEDLVHLLLREGGIHLLGLPHEGELLGQLGCAPHDEGRAVIEDGLGLFGHERSFLCRVLPSLSYGQPQVETVSSNVHHRRYCDRLFSRNGYRSLVSAFLHAAAKSLERLPSLTTMSTFLRSQNLKVA